MINRIIIVFLIFICSGCNGSPQNIIVFKKGSVVPALVVTDEKLYATASDFAALFEKATGQRLAISVTKPAGVKTALIIGFLKKGNSEGGGYFKITENKGIVIIEGTDAVQVSFGCRYFLSVYAGINQFNKDSIKADVQEVAIPEGLNYVQEYAFEYREPFFTDNFNPDFRYWNKTHTLEEHWALWGHNIGKVIKVTPKMLANVNGEINEEQLCFSSPELEQALTDFIRRQGIDNPLQDKFMVMPNDNDIVCQCNRCLAAGNTATNASPAVFSLLNRLAKKYQKKQFFSTAYVTTNKPPKFKLADNVGVMVSTMAFPKGVVIKNSGKKDFVEETLSGWKGVTNRIYLWDYAVNFDDYFRFYPTVAIMQDNLRYYKSKGVTGIFMHGREDGYAAFADLKCYLYAQLFQDVDSNVKEHIKLFFENKYPAAISKLLSDYYIGIENASYESGKALDIYGGMIQAKKKYLDNEAFISFYNSLFNEVQRLSVEERKGISPLLLALTFERLELLRVNGLGNNGYAQYNAETAQAIPLTEVQVLIDRLKQLQEETGIKTYNEIGTTIADYIGMWHSEIMKDGYKSFFYKNKFRLLSKTDEDYPDARILNDGAIGFNDYYNNWFLVTHDSKLLLEINADEVRKAGVAELSFLNDVKHKIYLPEKVTITVGGRVYEVKLPVDNTKGSLYKYKVNIPVEIKPEDKVITLQAVKQNDFKNRSIACDEIYFK